MRSPGSSGGFSSVFRLAGYDWCVQPISVCYVKVLAKDSIVTGG